MMDAYAARKQQEATNAGLAAQEQAVAAYDPKKDFSQIKSREMFEENQQDARKKAQRASITILFLSAVVILIVYLSMKNSVQLSELPN